MKLVVNRSSGTKHLPGDEKTTKCGASLIQNGEENASWEDSQWLDDFPQDFGTSMNDCAKCAEMMVIEE